MTREISKTTLLLRACARGEATAADELFADVYEHLRGIARRLVQGQNRNQTLQPTELINEAYVRLIDRDAEEGQQWASKLHFMRVAARAMRFVLVDRARARLSEKRGGARHRVTLDTQLSIVVNDADDLLFVHDGLEGLARFDPELGQIVQMRFFGGMTMEEIADALEVSLSTVNRGWRLARAWWIREFGDTLAPGADEDGGDA